MSPEMRSRPASKRVGTPQMMTRTLTWIPTLAVIAAFGLSSPASQSAPTTETQTEKAPALLKSRTLVTGIAIYRRSDDPKNEISDTDLEAIRKGFEYTRQFYYRNTGCRLNMALVILDLKEKAPAKLEDAFKEAAKLGLEKPDLFFGFGPGYSENLGGFDLRNGATGGAHAGFSHDFVETGPGDAPVDGIDANTSAAWVFAHEIQHAIEIISVPNSGTGLDLLSAHPYSDHEEKWFKGGYRGGMHWDWIALTLREFGDTNWLKIPNPKTPATGSVDADADGVPDDDPRMPIDEKRFGSDPTKADTDGDGLSDLEELRASPYAPSDPRRPDTDGDGIPDGEDPEPCVAIRPDMPHATGFPDLLEATILKPYRRNDGAGYASCQAGWNEKGLFFNFIAPAEFDVRLTIDGSYDNGFWEGGDSYRFHIGRDFVDRLDFGDGRVAEARVTTRRINERMALKSVFIPARLGQGVSQEINYGGKRRASDIVDGLTLAPGKKIGLSIQYHLGKSRYIEMTPQCHMTAITLR